MLKSIIFVVLLLGAIAGELFAYKIPSVLVFKTMDAKILEQFIVAFKKKMQHLGYKEGKNIHYEMINAEGDLQLAHSLLKRSFDQRKPSLVISVATLASKVAIEYTLPLKIPQVFMCVTDPVGAKLINEIGKPTGTLVTGKVHYIAAQTKVELMLNILRKKYPRKKLRLGFIHTSYFSDLSDLKRMQQAIANSKDKKIEFLTQEIPFRPLKTHKQIMLKELKAAIAKMTSQVDYFWAPRGALAVLSEHDHIYQELKAPLLVGATEESVKSGALIHITGDPVFQGADTAEMAHRILKGVSPGQIPPSLPSKIQFSINLKTAEKLQLSIPSYILELAKDRTYY